ncbi:MAG: HEAT repeat domain-containing protein, partial [Deltaproteobacteria bacterium]|nr:HEAT repeat domain-containing protein [Deltaproteobacteria bacterium]
SCAAKALFLGMLAAQAISTIQVYLSNVSLHNKITSIKDAGYLVIPNQHILNVLPDFGPAFFGGIFFTLSVGAGLCLYSIAAMWIWTRLLSCKKIYLILFLLPLAGCIVKVNIHGFSPVVTSYFLVIPAVIFISTSNWITDQPEQSVWLKEILHLVPLVILTLLWTFQMQSSMFIDIRDNLLLSNSFGRKINDFYYKYTLYPAEAFKSLHQKTIKTCSIDKIGQEPVETLLRNELLNRDYLDVGIEKKVDLKVIKEADFLVLKNRGKIILKTTLEDFLSSNGKVLEQFAAKSDKHSFFRKFTLFSLLVGFPISLYILVFSMFRFVLSFIPVLKPVLKKDSVYASILCFITGIGLLIPFYHMGEKEVNVKNVAKALESENRIERVEALKIINQRKAEIGNYSAYQSMLKSAHVPELYWLAKALSVSRKSETYNDLLSFLDNPHPNVVCMALYALGRRGDKSAVKIILKKIETSDHWYSQWYAYKALRTLGWKQRKLK